MTQIKIVQEKLTKKQVKKAVADGNTHCKFLNKGLQKRLLKNQAKVNRHNERVKAFSKKKDEAATQNYMAFTQHAMIAELNKVTPASPASVDVDSSQYVKE